MDELKSAISASLPENVTVESLPTDVNKDVTPESSPAAPVVTPTPKVEPEEPFHKHPRWQEMRERERVANERAERLERQLLDISNKLATPKEPVQDPYSGMTPEEKAFWSKVETIAEQKARAERERAKQELSQDLNEQKLLVTSLMYERFQQKHPDITPGSEDENSIAQKVRQGYSLEDAYTIVTAPKRIREAEETAVKRYEEEIKRKTKTKVAANLEGPNIPSNSPVQGQRKASIRDIVEQHMAGKLEA